MGVLGQENVWGKRLRRVLRRTLRVIERDMFLIDLTCF